LTCAYEKAELADKVLPILKKYLGYLSTDGNTERQKLRAEMAKILNDI
jgi:hypothetical protein